MKSVVRYLHMSPEAQERVERKIEQRSRRSRLNKLRAQLKEIRFETVHQQRTWQLARVSHNYRVGTEYLQASIGS